jgi:hypothetical protein
MQVNDDLYLGGFNATTGGLPVPSTAKNPTQQVAAGPMGRIAFFNIVPLTKQAANIAALQANTANTALTLTAGTGVTSGPWTQNPATTVYLFDVARSVSLTSAANLSAINYTIIGIDIYGRQTSQVIAGPNANTVTTLKTFLGVISVTPNTTSASTVSVGSADIFGLQYAMTDAGYITSNKWAGALAQDGGTFVVADTTSPATTATGDPRGTYAPSSASNGARRLVIGMHLNGAQCGASPTVVALIGVTPV